MTAAIIGGIGAIGSAVSGISQAGATTRAADVQAGAARQGQEALSQRFDETTRRLDPFIEGSAGAFQEQQALSGALGAEAEQEALARLTGGAGFQFLQQQGQGDINSAASARGQLGSGSRLKALSRFRTNLLGQQRGQRLNQLGQITNVGLNAAGNLSRFGAQDAAGQANLFGQAGEAGAAGILGRSQAFTSGLAGVTQGIGTILGGLNEPKQPIRRGLA